MQARWRRGIAGVAAIAVLVGAIACDEKKRPRRDDDDDEDDRPRRTTASASGSAVVASASGATSAAASAAPVVSAGSVRPDPVVTKTYRARACRYGAIVLKQARDAYVASLKGGPPSASNLPRFVGGSTLPSRLGSASSSSPAPPARLYTPRYETFFRHCSSALSIKDGADPALDAALKEFNDFASPLAKLLGEAAAYYGKDEYKSDSFAKGKELHACLTGSGTCTVRTTRAPSGPSTSVTRAFEQLDGKIAKLALALEQFEASHPIDKAKYLEGQRVSAKLVSEATAVLMAIDGGASGKAVTDAIARGEAALTELKALEGRDPPDSWAKAIPPMAGLFLKTASAIAKKTPDAITDQEVFELAQSYMRMLEKDYTALAVHLRAASGAPMRKMSPRLPPKSPDPSDSSDDEPDPP